MSEDKGLLECEAFAAWWAEKYCAPHHPSVNSVEAGYAFEGWKAANRAARRIEEKLRLDVKQPGGNGK